MVSTMLCDLQVVSGSKVARSLSLDDLKSLGVQEYTIDWHCVTGWTAQKVWEPCILLLDAPVGLMVKRVACMADRSGSWVSRLPLSWTHAIRHPLGSASCRRGRMVTR